MYFISEISQPPYFWPVGMFLVDTQDSLFLVYEVLECLILALPQTSPLNGPAVLSSVVRSVWRSLRRSLLSAAVLTVLPLRLRPCCCHRHDTCSKRPLVIALQAVLCLLILSRY